MRVQCSCINISTEDYIILDSVSANIMFFYSTCTEKVPITFQPVVLILKIDSLEQKVTQLCNNVMVNLDHNLKPPLKEQFPLKRIKSNRYIEFEETLYQITNQKQFLLLALL